MRFREFYGKGKPIISFELFPPKTEKGLAELFARMPGLIDLGPDFLTVTYGALGNTRDGTLAIASKIRNEFGMEVAHHLTCVALKREEIDQALDEIRRHNIHNIVALRGDIPNGEAEFRPPEGGYYHANQLVEHIRRSGQDVGIAVAGYPEKHLEATDFETDLRNLKRKVDAGADVIITQLFYDNRDFYRFLKRCRAMGISKPIVPGLMPILNGKQIVRITGVCGSKIPKELMGRLESAGDDEAKVQQIGIEHTTRQAKDLLEHGVEGIHFYVLNQQFHIAEIMEGIKPALALSKVKDGRETKNRPSRR